MPFSLRPFRRFPVQCAETRLSKAIDTIWNLNFKGVSLPWQHKS